MSEKKRIHINLIGTSGRSGKLGGGKTRKGGRKGAPAPVRPGGKGGSP